MVLEQASSEIVRKPWGSHDLLPWSVEGKGGDPVGEIWFHRSSPLAPRPALLLKLLFAAERLSVQVHPGDAYAQSMGLPNGKTEAWYVLAAAEGGAIAAGLKRPLTSAELRMAIGDGSIADIIDWREVHPDDAISIPAGTIHAIGAGLVIAEIQQRSDTTFRMFDYGRGRPLQIDAAVAVADAGPAAASEKARHLGVRTILVANSYFVLERLDLPPRTCWRINAGAETWFLTLHGRGRLGTLDATVGNVFFLDDGGAVLEVGDGGLSALVAYGGSALDPNLVQDLGPLAMAIPFNPALPPNQPAKAQQ